MVEPIQRRSATESAACEHELNERDSSISSRGAARAMRTEYGVNKGDARCNVVHRAIQGYITVCTNLQSTNYSKIVK